VAAVLTSEPALIQAPLTCVIKLMTEPAPSGASFSYSMQCPTLAGAKLRPANRVHLEASK
jgi:hypothetical protein